MSACPASQHEVWLLLCLTGLCVGRNSLCERVQGTAHSASLMHDRIVAIVAPHCAMLGCNSLREGVQGTAHFAHVPHC